MFYDMTWREFFLCVEAHGVKEWEQMHLFRLNYALIRNVNVDKKNFKKAEDLFPLSLDREMLHQQPKEEITLTEAREILKGRGLLSNENKIIKD